MAYFGVSASDQYFMFPAIGISVPPVTIGLWIKVSSIVDDKHTGLFAWRGTINTEFFLRRPNWELRYSIAGGTQWNIASGLVVTPGVWQFACVAISSTQARLYLGGASTTIDVSNATTTLNDTGYLGKDPLADGIRVSFNGALAEAAMWNATLTDAECRVLSNRVSPLGLTNRLSSLVFYKDLIRDVNRGTGPGLTPVNAPTVARHVPVVYPAGPQVTPPREFAAPYWLSGAGASTTSVEQALSGVAGADLGVSLPVGEVFS